MNYPAGTGTGYLDTGSMIANFFCLLCCCMNKKLILIINLLYSKFTWNVLTIWRPVAGLTNVQNGPITIWSKYPVSGAVFAGSRPVTGFLKMAEYPEDQIRISDTSLIKTFKILLE